MKRKIAWLFLLAGAAILIGGCTSPLTSKLPSDVVISLGLIGGTEGVTNLRGAQGGDFSVPVLISERQGRRLDADYEVTFVLSADTDPTTGTDYELGAETVTAGEETYVELTVEAAVPAANYNLIAYFAVADNDPGTAFDDDPDAFFNVSVRTIAIAPAVNALPDLQIYANELAGDFQLPASEMPVGIKITNNGYAAVPAGNIRVVAETSYGQEIGDATINLEEPLLPQASANGQISITLPTLARMAADLAIAPEDLRDYTITIFIEVDPENDIEEMVDVNNLTGIACQSGASKPDVWVSGILLPDGGGALIRGSSAFGKVMATVSNGGRALMDDYAVRLYVDRDVSDTFTTGDDVVGTWAAADTPNIAPGRSVQLMAAEDFEWPDIIGSYTLRAMIYDNSGEYTDGDEEGEDILHFPVAAETIGLVDSRGDLEITAMYTSLNAPLSDAGGNMPLRVAIKNSGTETVSANFTVTFFMSDDADLTSAADIELEHVDITDNIAAGGTKNLVLDTFPILAAPAGFYTVYAVVDSGGAVTELDEGNNQPADADEAFVYLPITDGVTPINARIMVYKPYKADEDTTGTITRLYNHGTEDELNNGSFDTTTPGSQYGYLNWSFDPAVTYRLRHYDWYYNTDYSFRLVPQYVDNVNGITIPNALPGEEASEPNNDATAAEYLTGSNNPWMNWVTGRVGYYNYDTGTYDSYDYYYFDL